MFSDRLFLTQGLPWWFSDNAFANSGDSGLIPGSGRSPGEGNGNPLQYSCLGNPMDRGDWGATVHGVTKSRTQLTDWTHTYISNIGKPSFMPFMPFYASLGFTDAAFFLANWKFVATLREAHLVPFLHHLFSLVSVSHFGGSSVAQSYPTLCNPMDCSMPGFAVLHCLLEFA